jgi:hypothetical protein
VLKLKSILGSDNAAAESAVSAFRVITNFTEDKMKTILVVMLLTVFAYIAPATRLVAAQDTTQEKPKAESAARWSGSIQRIDKDNSTLTVLSKSKGTTKTISYTTTTKWTNKAGATVDSTTLKQDDRVVCLGKYEGNKFVAAEIILQQ